jgi:hypothetical protein
MWKKNAMMDDLVYVVRKNFPLHGESDQCAYSQHDADRLKQTYIEAGYHNAHYDCYTHPEFLQLAVQKTGMEDIQKFDHYLLDKYQCPFHGEIRIRNTHDGTIIVAPINRQDQWFEMRVTKEELTHWHFLRTAWENRDNLEWFKKFHF